MSSRKFGPVDETRSIQDDRGCGGISDSARLPRAPVILMEAFALYISFLMGA
jgi:hypothetical protein